MSLKGGQASPCASVLLPVPGRAGSRVPSALADRAYCPARRHERDKSAFILLRLLLVGSVTAAGTFSQHRPVSMRPTQPAGALASELAVFGARMKPACISASPKFIPQLPTEVLRTRE